MTRPEFTLAEWEAIEGSLAFHLSFHDWDRCMPNPRSGSSGFTRADSDSAVDKVHYALSSIRGCPADGDDRKKKAAWTK